MKTRFYTPHYLLQPYVEAYAAVDVGQINRILAQNPTHRTIFCFDIMQRHIRIAGRPNDHYSLSVRGAVDQYISIEGSPQKVLQVIFKPCGAYRFFRMGMDAFVNYGTDIRLIFSDIQSTVAKMEDLYPDTVRCIGALEEYLLSKIHKSTGGIRQLEQIAFACNEIKMSYGDVKIKELCRHVNMSETQFRLHFTEKIGISPKSFCQIEKMNHVDSIIRANDEIDWAEICGRLNYYDQNHFIKNFKFHFGCTPSQMLKNKIAGYADTIA